MNHQLLASGEELALRRFVGHSCQLPPLLGMTVYAESGYACSDEHGCAIAPVCHLRDGRARGMKAFFNYLDHSSLAG